MAVRISRRAMRNSRSFSRRTRPRAMGTAIPVRIIMMAVATISSMSVMPRRLRRLAISLHCNGQLRRGHGNLFELGIPQSEIGEGDRSGSLPGCLEDEHRQDAGTGDAARAGSAAEDHGGLARV